MESIWRTGEKNKQLSVPTVASDILFSSAAGCIEAHTASNAS